MLSSLKKLLFNLHACHSGIFLKKYRICLSRFPHHTSFPFLLANLFMLFYIIFAIYFSVPQRPLSHHQLVRGFHISPLLAFSSCALDFECDTRFSRFSCSCCIFLYVFYLIFIKRESVRARESMCCTYLLDFSLFEFSHVLIVFGLVICFHFWLLTAL